MNLVKKIAIVSLAMIAMCANAQESPTGKKIVLPLSLADAQKYAIENNKTLQNASLDVKIAHAQRWQTIAAMLPQVDGAATYTNMLDYSMNLMGRDVAMPAYITHSVTASIGLNGQAIMGALLNNLAMEMQDITLKQNESNIKANVTSTYMSVLIMEDILSLLDSTLMNIEHLAEMTQRTVEVGAAEQTSADQLVVKVNALKNSINSNKRNLELSRNSLKVLLGLNAEAEIELTETIDELLSAEAALNLLTENFNINNNFNYQLLEKNAELAKKNVTMAALAYTPTISAYYQYTAKKYFSDEATFNMQPPHTVGASVSIPLWSSGKRAAGVTEKKLAYQKAVNTLNETADNLEIQNQQLRFNLNNAYETYVNEKDNIEVTKRVFQNITNKFQWGAASSLELTNASNDLITAQSNYVQAVLSLVNAQIELTKFLNNK